MEEQRRTEYRSDEYTMEGVRNMGGASLPEESLQRRRVFSGGQHSQGAMAGTSLALDFGTCCNEHSLYWMVSSGWVNPWMIWVNLLILN